MLKNKLKVEKQIKCWKTNWKLKNKLNVEKQTKSWNVKKAPSSKQMTNVAWHVDFRSYKFHKLKVFWKKVFYNSDLQKSIRYEGVPSREYLTWNFKFLSYQIVLGIQNNSWKKSCIRETLFSITWRHCSF